jgi:hypothetical protein
MKAKLRLNSLHAISTSINGNFGVKSGGSDWAAYPDAPADPYLSSHIEKIEIQSCEYLTRKRTREMSKR